MSKNFASNLARLRKERGMSQKEAAAGLKISQALLSHYENGIRECGLEFLMKAADFYSVTTDYLLGLSESKQGFAGAFTIKDDIETDKSMNTLTVYRVASRMRESMVSLNENSEYSDEINMLYGLILYRIILAEVKKGNFPESWVPNSDSLNNDIYFQIMTVLENRLVGSDHGMKSSEGDSEEVPLCVKTLVESMQHYIHEKCDECGINLCNEDCILCNMSDEN